MSDSTPAPTPAPKKDEKEKSFFSDPLMWLLAGGAGLLGFGVGGNFMWAAIAAVAAGGIYVATKGDAKSEREKTAEDGKRTALSEKLREQMNVALGLEKEVVRGEAALKEATDNNDKTKAEAVKAAAEENKKKIEEVKKKWEELTKDAEALKNEEVKAEAAALKAKLDQLTARLAAVEKGAGERITEIDKVKNAAKFQKDFTTSGEILKAAEAAKLEADKAKATFDAAEKAANKEKDVAQKKVKQDAAAQAAEELKKKAEAAKKLADNASNIVSALQSDDAAKIVLKDQLAELANIAGRAVVLSGDSQGMLTAAQTVIDAKQEADKKALELEEATKTAAEKARIAALETFDTKFGKLKLTNTANAVHPVAWEKDNAVKGPDGKPYTTREGEPVIELVTEDELGRKHHVRLVGKKAGVDEKGKSIVKITGVRFANGFGEYGMGEPAPSLSVDTAPTDLSFALNPGDTVDLKSNMQKVNEMIRLSAEKLAADGKFLHHAPQAPSAEHVRVWAGTEEGKPRETELQSYTSWTEILPSWKDFKPAEPGMGYTKPLLISFTDAKTGVQYEGYVELKALKKDGPGESSLQPHTLYVRNPNPLAPDPQTGTPITHIQILYGDPPPPALSASFLGDKTTAQVVLDASNERAFAQGFAKLMENDENRKGVLKYFKPVTGFRGKERPAEVKIKLDNAVTFSGAPGKLEIKDGVAGTVTMPDGKQEKVTFKITDAALDTKTGGLTLPPQVVAKRADGTEFTLALPENARRLNKEQILAPVVSADGKTESVGVDSWNIDALGKLLAKGYEARTGLVGLTAKGALEEAKPEELRAKRKNAAAVAVALPFGAMISTVVEATPLDVFVPKHTGDSKTTDSGPYVP